MNYVQLSARKNSARENAPMPTQFSDDSQPPAVRGFLHLPEKGNNDGLVLTHGAGSNCTAPLLVALSEVFAEHGYHVLRCDLPFRQQRPTGPPFPGQAERDRVGLRNAVAAMRKMIKGHIFLGGHSYGGRQATMLCAEESTPELAPKLVDGLLLLSYPLHPPRKPEQLRTQHLPNLHTPSLFVHGSRDPFGSPEEMIKALQQIPAKNELMKVEGAGHDLGFKGKATAKELPADFFAKFKEMFE
jgi:predicted alpha/beta-hydrolase family hydrolase